MKKIYFIAICILSIRPSNAVSFDCNKAITELEKKICSSEEIEAVTELEKTISSSQEISILETKVTATYTKLLLSNPEIKNNQIEWLKKISHCDKNTYVDCVKNAYTDRLSELNHQLHSTSWIAADDAREKQKAEMVNANGVGEISKAAAVRDAEKVAARDAERVAAAREAADTAAKAQVYADRLAGEKIYAGYQAQQVTQRATADATGKQNTEAEKLTTEKVQAAKTETTKKSADKATKDAVPKADSDRFVAEKVLADLQAKQASDRAREDEAERKAAIAVQKSKDEEFVKKFIY
jgi:uncharacterized protein